MGYDSYYIRGRGKEYVLPACHIHYEIHCGGLGVSDLHTVDHLSGGKVDLTYGR